MITIHHKKTGELILQWEGESLSEAELRYKDLQWANLAGRDLSSAWLDHANLQNATLVQTNLEGACLAHTNLELADLQQANLRGAILRGADLRWADLRKADLSAAELVNTSLTGARLEDARFTGTVFWDTVVADCQDLSLAIDLTTTEHDGPSTVDLRTLRSQIDVLPDEFLLGTGITLEELRALRAIYHKRKPAEERPENTS